MPCITQPWVAELGFAHMGFRGTGSPRETSGGRGVVRARAELEKGSGCSVREEGQFPGGEDS